MRIKNTLFFFSAILFFFTQNSIFAQTQIFDEELRDGSFPAGWTSQLGGTPPPIARTAAGGYFLISANDTWVETTDYDLSAFTNASLNFMVATFGSGADNPLEVEFSLDGGVSWSANTFTTATPTSTNYIPTGSFDFAVNNSSQVRLRFTRPAASGKGVRFRDMVLEASTLTNPNSFDLNTGVYEFTEWPASSPAGTFPANMAFQGHNTTDPDINTPMIQDWSCGYDQTGGSRFQGVGTSGVRMTNTGGVQSVANCDGTNEGINVGSIVLALNTTNRTDVTINWTGRLFLQSSGDRFANLALQYRIQDSGGTWPSNWEDVSGQIFESQGKNTGDSEEFSVTLCELSDVGEVQLRWVYYISPSAGTNGSRSNLGLDDVKVSSTPIVTPHVLANSAYIFNTWSDTEAAGTYPDNMVFLQHSEENPDINTSFEFEYTCAYDLGGRPRVNGLNNDGFSFLNTGNPQNDASCLVGGYLGAAQVAVNTEGMNGIKVDWTGIQKTTGSRIYAIQAQYRVGECGPFTSIAGQNWESDDTGNSNNVPQEFTFDLPADAENEEVVYLRWVYYQISGSGNRPEMAISEIMIYPETLYSTNSGNQTFGGATNTQTWSTDPSATGATFSPLFPGTNYVIQDGNTVTVRNVGVGGQQSLSFGNILIEPNGKLQADLAATGNIYINIFGNIVNNGEIGAIDGSNNLSFNVEPGDFTFSGNGPFNIQRIRKSNVFNNSDDLNLTIDSDINLWWDNSAAIYNNRSGSSNFNIVIADNRTLTIEGDLSFDGTAGGTGTDRGGSLIIENGAEVLVKGTTFLGNRNDDNSTSIQINTNGVLQTEFFQFSDPSGNEMDANLSIASNGRLVLTGEIPWVDAPDTFNSIALDLNAIVEFSRLGDQTISLSNNDFDYTSIVLSGSGEKTFTSSDALTVNNNLEITDDAKLVKSGATEEVYLLGDLESLGNPEIDAVFYFSGSNIQTVTGYAVFEELIFENTTGVVFPAQAGAFPSSEVRTGLTLSNNATFTAASNLTLLSDANQTAYLIDNSNLANPISGSINIERFIPGSQQGYRQISSPVENQNIELLNGFNAQGSNAATYEIVDYLNEQNNVLHNNWPNLLANAFTWDESASVNGNRFWQGFVSGIMQPANGQMMYTNGNTVLTFEGTPNTGDINVPLSYTSISAGNDGWNFVGNPYPSAINWDAVTTEYAVYVYDNSQNPNSFRGVYNTYINGMATNPGSFNGEIASGQSFFVKTSTPGSHALNFTNSARVADSSTNFFKQAENQDPLIRMSLSNEDYTDYTLVYFNENATNTFDQGLEAEKYFNAAVGIPSFYSLDSEKSYSIQALSTITDDMIIPLGVVVDNDGVYTFSIEELGNFPKTSMVFFEDAETGTELDLRNMNEYATHLAEGTHEGRFYLRVTAP
ncbi:MAG: hypothetical protein EA412_00720, partial [Chitinophagaceae bacterium]